MTRADEFRFESGALGLADIVRLAHDMWSDIAFDTAALARLRRDGLALDGVRLTGPCPYRFDCPDTGVVRVRVDDGAPTEPLLDLWRLHFAKSLRARGLAA